MTSKLISDSALLGGLDQVLKRLQRKVQMRVIKSRELVTLFRDYQFVQQIYLSLYSSCFNEGKKEALKQLFLSEEEVSDFNDCLTGTYLIVQESK
jgi:prephenate dehydratase